MNPLPIVWASLRRNGFTSVLFVVVVALVVAFGIAISAQERALRSGSVRAADKFDLIVAAPGSFNDVLLSTVYLNPSAVELLDPAVSASLLAEPATEFVAPIGFGDSIDGAPLVGTIAPFVEYLSGGLGEGRMFAQINEAVVGALAPFSLGDELEVHHGTEAGGIDADAAADALEAEAHDHEHEHEGDHHGITVVGRMLPTGTPWDRASVVPIEYDWEAHGLVTGHTAGDMRIGPRFEARPLPGHGGQATRRCRRLWPTRSVSDGAIHGLLSCRGPGRSLCCAGRCDRHHGWADPGLAGAGDGGGDPCRHRCYP